MDHKELCKTSEAQALFRDLDKPSLHALSYALRHPDTWPKGFTWDYRDCSQCALGLAHHLWKNLPSLDSDPFDDDDESADWRPTLSEAARSFALPYSAASKIFLDAGRQPENLRAFGLIPTPRGSVTPEMVADQIDAYLATRE